MDLDIEGRIDFPKTERKRHLILLTCTAFHQCGFVDDSIASHAGQILCRIPRIRMAFRRCAYVRDFSSVVIVRTAYRMYCI